MKNIIAGISTLIVIALMAYTASQGGAYHGGEHGKIIKDFGDKMTNAKVIATPKEKSDREKEDDKLLKELKCEEKFININEKTNYLIEKYGRDKLLEKRGKRFYFTYEELKQI